MSNCTGNIIWLASYPKSGNTWTRLFLHALKSGKAIESFDSIVSTEGIGSNRILFDHYLGVDSDEMGLNEVNMIRAKVYEFWSAVQLSPIILKTHDTPFHKGIRIISEASTKKVILIVRNPFDMVASYANHMSIDLEKSIYSLNNDANEIAKTKIKYASQLSQHIGSWSSYYLDWKNAFRDNILVVKYEDLKSNPFESFKALVEYLDWKYTDEEIQKAIEHSDFKKVKAVEEEKGFMEAPKKIKTFFRSGKSGNWRNEISEEQAEELVNKHYSTLLELGYVDSEGSILV